MTNRPLITLTTDFGHSDHFVAVMKAVILERCPGAQIIDVSHEVRPFEIAEGAFLIAQAYSYFPKRTIHLVVVDPGVGTARRPILIEAAGQFFIGPDNGVLSMVYSSQAHKAREIKTEKYFRQPVSRTFHGRDIFAPVAGHVAAGLRPSLLGPIIKDHLKLDFGKPPRTGKRAWTGTVLKIDRFGNMITNFHMDDFAEVQSRPFEMAVGLQKLHRLALTYTDVDAGEAFVIVGSSGYLEVATNQGSAAKVLGCGVGAPVELSIY